MQPTLLTQRIHRYRLQGGTFVSDVVSPRLAQSDPRRTIFEKDVLRTGVWSIGDRKWVVGAETLRRLKTNFEAALARGVRIPVVWNHSADARDKIGEALSVRVAGDTLWARFWAAHPDDVRRLRTVAGEVSVEVRQPWRDGRGRLYDIMLTHIGVVNLPVVPGQQPFRELRLSHSFPGAIRMSDATVQTPAHHESGNERELVRAFNQILQRLPGWPALSEEATVGELTAQLEAFLDELTARSSVATASQSQETIHQLQARVDELTQQLSLEKERAAEQRRRQFLEAIDRLVSEGRVAPADRDGLIEAGEPTGYRLSLLAPFERVPAGSALPLQPTTRRLATADPPDVTSSQPMTAERAREIAQSFR